MADENGPASAFVEALAHLAATASGTDYFQFLRRLEALYRELPRLGAADHPSAEPVRLGQRPSTAFAPSALRSFTPGEDGEPHRLEVAFLGLFGPNGPLPLALTEFAQRRSAAARRIKREDPFVDLVDMFHQRVLTLLYRAWASSRAAVQHDRPNEDAFERYLGALTGDGELARFAPDGDRRGFARHFAGLLANQTRNPENLEIMVGALLGAPVQVEPFVGEWLDIPEDYAWRLDQPAHRSTRELGLLGESTMLGPQVFARRYKFRLIVGPADHALVEQLLPGGALLLRLRRLVRSYVGNELRWDVKLVLASEMAAFVWESSSLGDTTYLASGTAAPVTHHMVDPFAA